MEIIGGKKIIMIIKRFSRNGFKTEWCSINLRNQKWIIWKMKLNFDKNLLLNQDSLNCNILK